MYELECEQFKKMIIGSILEISNSEIVISGMPARSDTHYRKFYSFKFSTFEIRPTDHLRPIYWDEKYDRETHTYKRILHDGYHYIRHCNQIYYSNGNESYGFSYDFYCHNQLIYKINAGDFFKFADNYKTYYKTKTHTIHSLNGEIIHKLPPSEMLWEKGFIYDKLFIIHHQYGGHYEKMYSYWNRHLSHLFTSPELILFRQSMIFSLICNKYNKDQKKTTYLPKFVLLYIFDLYIW
jgi:hypothetical protein